MFGQIEQLARARFSWTESSLLCDNVAVNVFGEQVYNQSLKHLVRVAQQGYGSETTHLGWVFPWFQEGYYLCFTPELGDFVATGAVVEEM